MTTVETTFYPSKSGNYTSIYRLSLVGIPTLTGPGTTELISAEFELNGTCEPVVGQLLPPVVDIPGEIPAGSRLKRQIHLMNPRQSSKKDGTGQIYSVRRTLLLA